MKSEEVEITLENLAEGGAVEIFNAELSKALENITDPNTDPKATREVKLVVKIKPHENRRSAAVSVAASAKLAAVKDVGTVVFIGRQAGKTVATASNAAQMRFGLDAEHEERTN